MKKSITFLAVVLLCLFIGCTKSNSAPSCSDDQVKKLVIQLSTQKLRNQLMPEVMRRLGIFSIHGINREMIQILLIFVKY